MTRCEGEEPKVFQRLYYSLYYLWKAFGSWSNLGFIDLDLLMEGGWPMTFESHDTRITIESPQSVVDGMKEMLAAVEKRYEDLKGSQ